MQAGMVNIHAMTGWYQEQPGDRVLCDMGGSPVLCVRSTCAGWMERTGKDAYEEVLRSTHDIPFNLGPLASSSPTPTPAFSAPQLAWKLWWAQTLWKDPGLERASLKRLGFVPKRMGAIMITVVLIARRSGGLEPPDD